MNPLNSQACNGGRERVPDACSGTLCRIGSVANGAQFSGIAVYAEDDAMFAMISASGTVYMKADATTAPVFHASGAEPFWYMRGNKRQEIQSLLNLPESALDDPDEALYWARLALPPARVAAAEKQRQKARRNAR
ncbi:TfoX/Sxy family protein [Thalassovita litoralis]|uniref:TfoX/Sxy family protein n=1 Tax=Thalassovita litoralis TaxID=1010611 RepID=UPI001159A0A3